MAGALSPLRPGPLRRPGVLLTALVVTAVHLWLGDDLLEDRLGFGAARETIRRMEVAYVRELAVAPPPETVVAAPVAVPRPRRTAAAKPAKTASAPASATVPAPPPDTQVAKVDVSPPPMAPESTPDPAPPLLPQIDPASNVPPLPAEPASLPAAPAAVPAAAVPEVKVPAAPQAQPFDWPPSTRLGYQLAGNYRGEVQGDATVEWIRVGTRYQVHLEAVVGPPFAPLLVRRVSSEGELGDRGLAPRRFDGEQRVAFRSRRWSMQFEPERVKLPEGREAATLPGVQDEASLFVQLTWIFTTQPHLLKVGQTIEIPLALPRRVEVWQYDVVAEETLSLPFAEVPTVHVKPRRPPRPGGDMTAQIWFAPGLQYLPVRILIHQDPQTFVDLVLKRPPQQAAAR